MQILDRADPTNTNVYVGNLSPSLSGEQQRCISCNAAHLQRWPLAC